MKGRLFCVLILAMAVILAKMALPAAAGERIILPLGYQESQLKALARDLGLIISPQPATTAEALGVGKLDLSVGILVARIDPKDSDWADVYEGGAPKALALPQARLTIGLPVGLDAGLTYARSSKTELGFAAGEIKWSLIPSGPTLPSLAVRAAYAYLLEVDDLSLDVYSLDLLTSYGVGFAVFYLGGGGVLIRGDEDRRDIDLGPVRESAGRAFVGIRLYYGTTNLTVEFSGSETPAGSLRLGLIF